MEKLQTHLFVTSALVIKCPYTPSPPPSPLHRSFPKRAERAPVGFNDRPRSIKLRKGTQPKTVQHVDSADLIYTLMKCLPQRDFREGLLVCDAELQRIHRIQVPRVNHQRCLSVVGSHDMVLFRLKLEEKPSCKILTARTSVEDSIRILGNVYLH